MISNSDAIAEKIGFLQNAVGAILSPFDSWLVLRGVKTLAVRMKQHEANGSQQKQQQRTHFCGQEVLRWTQSRMHARLGVVDEFLRNAISFGTGLRNIGVCSFSLSLPGGFGFCE